MKYLKLISAGLLRRKSRTILTLLSIIVAFLLYGPLETVRATFLSFGQSTAGNNRLVSMSKVSPGAPLLPQSLYGQISEVQNVVAVDYAYAFGGTYQDPKNVIALETHTETFFDLYPELELSPAERDAFRTIRTGMIASRSSAQKYNWKVGDKIPFQTSVDRKDGTSVWTFDLVGLYEFSDPGMKVWDKTVYVNWKGVDEARVSGNGNVGWYVVQINDAKEADNVAHAIDAISANSDHETKTQTENAFSAGWISQLGDLGLIVTGVMTAVFFTLLLLTGHSIAQSVAERISELAILKTIGFTGVAVLALVLCESIFLLLLGCIVGLGIATLLVELTHFLPPGALPVPLEGIGMDVWMRGLVVAVVIGAVVGALPAIRGLRLQIVDALSGH